MTSPDQNYTSWHCGMRVVCVDSEWTVVGTNRKELKDGSVYTISWIGTCPEEGIVCIRLQEVTRRCDTAEDRRYWGLYGEVPFRASRFRPVQTRQTDISVFTAMLSPKPAKAGKVRA